VANGIDPSSARQNLRRLPESRSHETSPSLSWLFFAWAAIALLAIYSAALGASLAEYVRIPSRFVRQPHQWILCLDVIVSAVVLICFIQTEGKRLGIRLLWLPTLAVLLVGVSLGLPLFLYLRQLQLDRISQFGKAL
jgi:FtsH-binding integral membrane protein